MRDGGTRKMTDGDSRRSSFLSRYRVSLVVTDGPAAGSEYELDKACITVGRGPGVDFAFDDDHMSRQHVALDVTADGFRVRDLGSTNGIAVNGNRVDTADLEHGDRLAVGSSVLQYVVEELADSGPTYVVSP